MENEVKRDERGKPDKFKYKEPFVLSSILCLMLVCGITAAVGSAMAHKIPSQGWHYALIVMWDYSPISALGVLLLSILSETKGRKPTFITLSAASMILTVSSCLHTFHEVTCLRIVIVLQKIIRGGIFATSFLAIPEFCSPKHRFTYLIANIAAFNIGRDVPHLFNLKVESIVTMSVVQGFVLVIEMYSLGVAFVGPESPYWLARRDRIEESKRAFLWLRGEGSEAELSSILKQHQNRNVRVFWLSLLAGMSAISVSAFTCQMISFSQSFYSMLEGEERYLTRLGLVIVILPIIARISYKVNHKLIFLVTSIPLGFLYVLIFWSYFRIVDDYYHIIKYIRISIIFLLYVGPFLFGIVSCAEIIPSKYNTYVNCICFIYLHLMIPLIDYLLVCYMHLFPIYCLYASGLTLSFICLFVFYFSCPETKDKMLLDIQKLYSNI